MNTHEHITKQLKPHGNKWKTKKLKTNEHKWKRMETNGTHMETKEHKWTFEDEWKQMNTNGNKCKRMKQHENNWAHIWNKMRRHENKRAQTKIYEHTLKSNEHEWQHKWTQRQTNTRNKTKTNDSKCNRMNTNVNIWKHMQTTESKWNKWAQL